MIELRPPSLEHAEPLAVAVRESVAELAPWMEWASDAYDVEVARTWIRDQIHHREAGTAFEFLITDSDNGILGSCGVNRISAPPHRFANLGYWVRTSAAGRGVAPNAVRQLAEWAFSNTNLIRLEVVVAAGNDRSRRVAEKAGAHFEGLLRSRLWTRQPQDALMYSLVPSDVQPA